MVQKRLLPNAQWIAGIKEVSSYFTACANASAINLLMLMSGYNSNLPV
jgi:hypothetical protein